jgi:hypothetical protein
MRLAITRTGVLAPLLLLAFGLASCTPPSPGGGGHANGLATAQITVTPSTIGLPPGPTTLAVSGTDLRPNTQVAIAQCIRRLGEGANCLELAVDVAVSSTGGFGPTPVTVSYLINFSGVEVPCSNSHGNTCFLTVQYQDTGEPVVPEIPLVFVVPS